MELSDNADVNVKWYNCFGKLHKFLEKLSIYLPYNLVLHEYLPNRDKTYLYTKTYIYISFIYKLL